MATITPDGSLGTKTKEKLDKDRFRRDLGGVQEVYNWRSKRFRVLAARAISVIVSLSVYSQLKFFGLPFFQERWRGEGRRMKARIYITLRAGVLDPQGKAVVASLKTLGFDEVNDARIGKFIELELDGAPREAAIERIGKMCEKLLANTVIENYRIEVD